MRNHHVAFIILGELDQNTYLFTIGLSSFTPLVHSHTLAKLLCVKATGILQ